MSAVESTVAEPPTRATTLPGGLAGLLSGRLHDPDRVILRRSLRVMIFSPLLFALTGFALGRPTMALFASFGSFCMMAMTDLGGPLRRRFVGTLVITALCAGLIALGTVMAHWIVVAAVGMGIVAFLVRFAGLFGGYAVASGPALTLAFVLAVALPTTDSPLPDRLLGWIAGGVVAAFASVLLWPAHERRAISAALATACEAIADLLEELARNPRGSDVGPIADRAHDALVQARARWRSTARRPVGPSIHDRAIVRAIDHTAWVVDLARLFATRGNVDTGDVELLRWNASDLRASADALRSNGPVAIGTGVALRQQRIAALEAEVGAAAGDAAQAADVAARLERAFPSLAISSAVLSLAADIGAMHGQDVTADVPLVDPVGGRSLGRFATRAGQLARAQLTPDGFWLREGIRYGLALAIAIAIALAGDVPHAFWVALGTLSVLRSNALSTGYTVAQSLLGTFMGFLAAAGLVSITSSDWFLWTLLPITVFLSAYTPSAVHFVLGQASFTVFVVVLFNLLEPQGWKTGLVRLGDIAVGATVSLVVSVVFWPRGASATLRTTAMAAIAAGGRFIATVVEARFGRAGLPAEADVVRSRRAAIGADRRAGEAYVAFLGERGQRRMPADTGASLVSVGVLLQLAGAALDATTAPKVTGGPFDTARAELTDEAAELARRLDRPDATGPAAESWVGCDTASLAACIADPAAADAAPDIVALAWVGAWLRHVGFLADRAAVVGREAAVATSQHWWAGSPP
jgi:uncharacterized membrane protein YccC